MKGEIKLVNGKIVAKADYIDLKTKDLKEFGYTNITTIEVEQQVDKILNNERDLSVIGMFCKQDIDVKFT